MTAEAVRAVVLAFWMAHGATPGQADALVAQAKIESGLQPCAKSRLGSWLYGWVGSRRRELAQFAGTTGCPSLQAQLQFALGELRSRTYGGFWSAPRGRELAELRACYGHGRC